MPTEPSLTLIAGLTAVAVGAAAVVHRRFGLFLVLSAIALVAGGVALMTLRTALVATPVISADYTGDITGWVESIEQTGPNVRRLVVVVDQLEDLAPSATPRKVRITVRARFEGVGVGAGISGLVALFPPPGPVIPGGYDFGRDLFYRGIGGSGFSYGAPDLIDLGPPPFSIRMLRPVSDIRNKIGARIEAAVPNEAGGILKALVTGDRGGISDETTDILRRAGLGHILAISGLHMALVVGAVFGGLRALLALSPALALRRPIKKWAAVGALAAALAYLLLSGGSIATQRAFIMATVVLVAVLIDRRAFSIRNVAVAATIILLLTPEALITASFQMSFAATIALIAGFEFLAERRRKRRSISRSPDQSIGRTIWLWVSGMAMTSLLAGLATAPFAAFHFHRTAPLSLFANVAAMPIFTLLVMPMALLGVLLMPLGLEQIPLAIAGWGIGNVVDIATVVSEWSGSAGLVPSVPALSMTVVALGMAWLCLWSQPWRLASVPMMVVGIAVGVVAARPTIIIAADASAAAIRGADGRYVVIGDGARFETEAWLRADADPRDVDDPSVTGGILCDPAGCTAPLGDTGYRLAVTSDPLAIAEDCRMAAIIVTELIVPANCDAFVVDGTDLARGGAHAIYLQQDERGQLRFQVTTARSGTRPWIAEPLR